MQITWLENLKKATKKQTTVNRNKPEQVLTRNEQIEIGTNKQKYVKMCKYLEVIFINLINNETKKSK